MVNLNARTQPPVCPIPSATTYKKTTVSNPGLENPAAACAVVITLQAVKNATIPAKTRSGPTLRAVQEHGLLPCERRSWLKFICGNLATSLRDTQKERIAPTSWMGACDMQFNERARGVYHSDNTSAYQSPAMIIRPVTIVDITSPACHPSSTILFAHEMKHCQSWMQPLAPKT